MGASDSKLVFKQGIFKLSEQKDIPNNDGYWNGFWELPESAEDIFTLFSPTDVRRTRDNALGNLETLILTACNKLIELRNTPAFPDPELAPERYALNCVRILSRVLPFVYEADSLAAWEDTFFWAPRAIPMRQTGARTEVLFDGANGTDTADNDEAEEQPKGRPLGEELIDTLVDLLFYSEFTLPKAPPGKPKVSYAIWQTGVGCHTPVNSTKEYENNRKEILRLLLVMCGKGMYMPANILPVTGVRATTYLTSCADKQTVLSLLCSLLNTTLKYNPAAWRVPYDHVVFRDNKQLLVTYCLQLLLVLVLYPIPETQHGVVPKNYFRHFLGRLHRPQDFQFLVDGMTRILNQPMQANSSYLPGSQKSLTWAPEMIMLFWEALQCNKRFRSFIIDTDRSHDFVILVLFYALENKMDPAKQGLIRMCVFVLQTMSVERNFGKSLNKRFEGQETLPQSIRIPNFHGTYADYLITSIHTLLTTGKGRLEAIYPALLAILNNVAPYLENLARATSSKLLQLLASMSSPSFLFANETNHSLLQSLLEVLNAIVEHQYSKNTNVIHAILRSKKRFVTLREFTLEGGQEELERQAQLRKEQQERDNSLDGARSPVSIRSPNLSNVPEEHSAFAIGDDDEEDSDDEDPRRPLQRPATNESLANESIDSALAASVASSADEALPTQLRGMSEKARGKMPIGQRSFSRTNSISSLHSLAPTATHAGAFQPSAEWIESWQPELPLHTILTLLEELSSQVPEPTSEDTSVILAAIRRATVRGIDPSAIRVHLFEWSPLSMGWYESLLWGFIFAAEMLVSKGTAGVWNGTYIKLFHVQATAAQTPSLLAPRGAVDAVGSNLVSRIGSLSFRGSPTTAGMRGSTPNSPVVGGNTGSFNTQGTVPRDL
ncbi:hypothetical protein BT63DRAFT_108320 [Microthyrium microscopicum]|uniref:High-temperature-induced dauer-formation protein n=1 Tax=Microthyrium microscopicum TaxID=703497 RepID=A0A6A6TU87_9PEZI|nr:hypothetical protein BT63DRAFT_108320 [Microthyrium microscopicum]